ncbi:hypothetical protein BGZ52_005580 [Haplosporangium bisporale]|nr:hypothetical protein BGZ52_005580 [Haplosporangium bisporale]
MSRKLVISPEQDVDTFSNWIKPTRPTNADLVTSTSIAASPSRNSTEGIIKQRLQGWPVTTGSVFEARLKAQTHIFRIVSVEYDNPLPEGTPVLGIFNDTTELEIILPTVALRDQTFCGGMDKLVGEICQFITDSFRHVDAYTRLNIPNTKAVLITGVSGSGKKTLAKTCCHRVGLRIFPLSLARTLADKEIMESDRAAALSHIRTVFDRALQAAPSAIVIEDMDVIAKDISTEARSNGSVIHWSDMAYALESSKPSQQAEFDSFVHQRRWSDFGGYSLLKKRVHQAVHWPITNPETFKRMGVKPPMGLLLYGPSGCGKTMLVHALASESNMNFIPIKGPEIFSKYLGETEATLRRLFAMARQIAPCILFFDEMDSIGAKRGWGGDGDSGSSNGVSERVLSTLLNEMDGVEERTGVVVIGCTNQPRAIDDALLRPGRLDQLIYVGYPTLKDRREIIDTVGRTIPLPQDTDVRARLARATVGFSPADLDALFREAAIMSLRKDIASTRVDITEIEAVIQKMSPSVQTRVDKSVITSFSTTSTPDEDVQDVLVPDLYREFQQDR